MKNIRSIIIKTLSLLLIIFILHLSYLKLGASSAAEKFISLIFDNQAFEAYEMTSKSFRENTPFSDFENIAQISTLGQLGEFAVTSSDLGLKNWQFHNTLKGQLETRTSGIEFDFEITLRRNFFSWEILFFKLPPSQPGISQ